MKQQDYVATAQLLRAGFRVSLVVGVVIALAAFLLKVIGVMS